MQNVDPVGASAQAEGSSVRQRKEQGAGLLDGGVAQALPAPGLPAAEPDRHLLEHGPPEGRDLLGMGEGREGGLPRSINWSRASAGQTLAVSFTNSARTSCTMVPRSRASTSLSTGSSGSSPSTCLA